MKCKLCEDKLLEYLYGELGEEDAAAMERHLETSETCRREYEGLASVLETVAEAEEEGPPPAMHTRIMGHAEEARAEKRSLWAWLFRPAVTTAVIGVIAAGVYFTSLRHKPPSYLDEGILSEESLLRSSQLPGAPPPSSTRVDSPREESIPSNSIQPDVPSSLGAKDDSPRREKKEQTFPPRFVEPPRTIEPEEATPELEGLKKWEPRIATPPSILEESFMAADEMDEETSPAPARMKAGIPPSDQDRTIAGKAERANGPAYGTRAAPTALQASPDRDLVVDKTRVPDTIVRAIDLASQGLCAEAGEQVDAYATEHQQEEACGAGWLEVARCYAKKGYAKAAQKMAEKAVAIPALESEARAFLDALPSPAER